MMIQAKGPVWHQKQKKQGIIPKGLTGIDREATWSKSNADGWVYGHGTFIMDSKADDCGLFRDFKEKRRMNFITQPRRNMDKTPERRAFIQAMQSHKNKQYYKERSQTVEPMQGIVKDIFDLDRCWMRGNQNNRWLFAAMGIAIQMHQLQAYQNNQSTWAIKSEVLGNG